MSTSRAFFRRRAIERLRDPGQAARNEAAAADMRARVAQQMAELPAVRQLLERTERPTAGTG